MRLGIFDKIFVYEFRGGFLMSTKELKIGSEEYTKSVIKAIFLANEGHTYENVEQAMQAYQKVTEELSYDEIIALGQLYNQENPITFAEIISSNHRVVQYAFLEKMGELIDDVEKLNDLELKSLVVEKLFNEHNRKRAEKLFFIQR